jgi:hypothetical protein
MSAKIPYRERCIEGAWASDTWSGYTELDVLAQAVTLTQWSLSVICISCIEPDQRAASSRTLSKHSSGAGSIGEDLDEPGDRVIVTQHA